MSYTEKNLVDGEAIAYRAHYHWVIYRTALLLLFFAALLGAAAIYAARVAPDEPVGRYTAIAGGAFAVLALLAALSRWIHVAASEFVVTNHRVIRKVGLFAREIEQAPLDKIQDITVEQGILGRILNYGDVALETASERGTVVFPSIDHPEGLRNALWGHSPAARSLASPAGAPVAAPAVSSPAPRGTSSERLAELERLRQQGLISDSEFAEKRREILARL